MDINGLPIPFVLESALATGLWGKHSVWKDGCFAALFPNCYQPSPELFSFSSMVRENGLWSKPERVWRYYIGATVPEIIPGSIDPTKAIIIGSTEPDSPIALDYRTSPPRVIYLCDINKTTVWVEAARGIESILNAIGKDG